MQVSANLCTVLCSPVTQTYLSTKYTHKQHAHLFKFCLSCLCTFIYGNCRRVFILFYVDTPEGPPTPQLPFQCPHPDKRGTNLLCFDFCIDLPTHQDLKLKCRRIMGQKLRYGRLCTTPPTGILYCLAQPHIASFSSELHWPSHAGTILEVRSELLFLWLDLLISLHPSACASDFWTCPQTLSFTQLAHKGCQSTGPELRIPIYM